MRATCCRFGRRGRARGHTDAAARVFAALTTSLFLLIPSTARADGAQEEPQTEASTAKKAVVVSLAGVSVLAFATSFIFLAQASSSDSHRRDLIESRGGDPDRGADSGGCHTNDECAQLRALRKDSEDAADRWEAAIGVGALAALASVGTALLWPNSPKTQPTARIVPTTSRDAAGAQLQVRF